MSELRKRTSAANVAKTTKPATMLTATIADPTAGHLGITLANAEHSIGVLVEHVDMADLCAKAGLRPGHVITSVGGKAVSTHEECLALLSVADAKPVTLTYLTPEGAAEEIEAAQAKYKTRRKKMGYGVLITIVLLVLGALTAVTLDPTLPSKIKAAAIDHLRQMEQQMSANQQPPAPPRPPLEGFELEMKKTEVKNKLAEFDKEYPTMSFMAKAMAETLDNGSTDPRDVLQQIEGMKEEAKMFAEMSEQFKAQNQDL